MSRRLGGVWVAVVLGLGGAGVTPAAGSPIRTATLRGVSATLTTKLNRLGGHQPVPVRLTILDHGQTGFSGPLQVPCDFCELSPPGAGAAAVQVRDLDRHGGPQVLVYLDDSGNDFFTTLAIYQRGTGGAYHPVLLHSLYVLGTETTSTRVRRHGARSLQLVSDDLRYLRFAGDSESDASLPPVLWRYANGELSDVSAGDPGVLGRNATRAWHDARAYERGRLSNTDVNGPDPRGPLATYAADEVRLGHRAVAERRLQAALADGWLNEPDRPHGLGYVQALNRLLGTKDTKPGEE